jgi:hypothetical protein
MNENLQDDALVKADLREHERLKSERAPWEAVWREIDERFPDGAGGFTPMSPGGIRGQRNFDMTHITALERFAAAGVAITTPAAQQYIRLKFRDPELMKLAQVKQWAARAQQRLYDIRHALHTGFGAAANEDWDQLGRYGTSAMWTDRRADGRGLFYKVLHLSECFIDTDYAGLVNRVHRFFTRTAAQLEAQFGLDALTPKMRQCLKDGNGKENTPFEILHVVCPNTEWDKDRLDWRAMPIASRYLAVDEKAYIKRAGFQTMPVSVSRHMTSPNEKYGRSPAIKMMPTIAGLQAMRRITLRTAHKAADPALLFHDEIKRLASKPGGLNPGAVDEGGRALVQRMPGGELGLPFAENETERERNVVRTAFLEEFYKILTDPNSRMTTTEVLEVMGKQGVLVRPFADRYATEKMDPVTQRDLDLALRWGQIDPLPPEVREAGAWPMVEYENPLAAMARAESTAKTQRWLETLIPLANVQPDVLDIVAVDEVAAGAAEEIGVNPMYVRSPQEVARLRQARAESQEAAINAELLEKSAGATLDLAKAGQIAAA